MAAGEGMLLLSNAQYQVGAPGLEKAGHLTYRLVGPENRNNNDKISIRRTSMVNECIQLGRHPREVRSLEIVMGDPLSCFGKSQSARG